MIKMINRTTGTEMWVHETRLDEYLEAGHKLAPAPEPPKTVRRTRKQKPDKTAPGSE